MNATNLIRCVAATLAASALLSAQAAPAPQPGPAAPRARSDGKSADRMQVRLAEVIAMLEEDDLSPEQRAQAKRKLEEIVAKLRETPAPATSLTPAAGADAAPRALRVARTPATEVVVPQEPEKPARAGGADAAPRALRVARTPGTEVVVAPQEPAKPSQPLIVEKRAGRAGESPTVVYRTEAGEYKVSKPVEVRGRVDYSVGGDTQDPAAKSGDKDVEKLQAEARKLRAEADAMRAKIRALTERDDEGAEAKKLGAARGLLEKSRADAVDAARASERARARDQAAEAEVRAKRAHDEEHETRRAHEEAQADEVRGRVLAPRALPGISGDLKGVEVAPLPARARMRQAAPADGDAEIKKLMQDMRDEMRAIRELLQQMRKQAQTWPAQRGLGGDNNALGQANGQAPSGFRSWYGTGDSGAAPRQDGWRGSFGGAAGQDAGSGKGPAFGESANKPYWNDKAPEGGKPPFWNAYGQSSPDAPSGARRGN